MKHPKYITFRIVIVFLLSSLLTIFSFDKFYVEASIAPEINVWLVAGIFVLMIALGTWFWLKVMHKPNVPVIAFAFAVGLAMGRATTVYFGDLSPWLRVAFVVPALLFYSEVLFRLQNRDTAPFLLYQINNVVIVISTVVIGGVVGAIFPWWMSVLLLGLAAIYDAVAVWKTKHMVALAEGLISKGIIPGISYPYYYEGKNNLALLGGGDIMFISLVSSSLFALSHSLAIISVITMSMAVVLLFIFSSPKRFYPALPFIFAGLLIAFPIWWLI